MVGCSVQQDRKTERKRPRRPAATTENRAEALKVQKLLGYRMN